MFGSEADGLSQELIDYSTDSLKIEMKDNVESLNLATSVSVIMYELF
jgi:TrmH family RNA methyltransferase